MISLQSGKRYDIFEPHVYRYMDKEFVDLFFNKGILRLSSIARFRDYPDEIRGDKNEGKGSVSGKAHDSGFRMHVMTPEKTNAYILSTSTIESENLRKKFESDSCFRIQKPLDFAVAIGNAIPGMIHSIQGFCVYRDHRLIDKLIENLSIKDFTGPEGTLIIGGQKGNQRINEIIGEGVDLMFLKERKYQDQCEYRFAWKINTKFYRMSKYIDIECKEAVQFCEKL